MTKGIAVQTILMLLVGILVVGIIVYMVYRYFVGAPLAMEECRARAITWCTACKNVNWGLTAAGPSITGTDLETCANQHFPTAPTGCDTAQAWCSAFIPTT